MSSFADHGFVERRNLAATAKKAQLDKFKASLNQDDPAAAQRRAERQTIIEARKAREEAEAAYGRAALTGAEAPRNSVCGARDRSIS